MSAVVMIYKLYTNNNFPLDAGNLSSNRKTWDTSDTGNAGKERQSSGK